MKYIYILTEEGRAWSQAGLDWIEHEMKPRYHETDETIACAGALYNSPQLMIDELTKHPDSYIIISYEHIDIIPPVSIPAVTQVLKNHLPDDISTWEILRHSAEENQ